MKIEWMGDITLMQTADGREFYVPGHVDGEETFRRAHGTEQDVAPRIILSGTKDEVKEAAKWFNHEASVTPSTDADADFWRLCEEHLKHARAKHPEFAKTVSTADPKTLDLIARISKTVESPCVEDVLFSEIYEFLAELQRGNKARAREEAADIVAVVLRAIEGDHLKEQQA